MAQESKVTIADIARRANVSKSTVSRVLTGNSNVVEEKRVAINEAMAELNYQPNIFARGLVRGRSLTIGVLTQNFGSPLYDAILRNIVQRLQGTDYAPIFADGQWEPEVEKQALRTLVDRRVDGLIAVGGLIEGRTLVRMADGYSGFQQPARRIDLAFASAPRSSRLGSWFHAGHVRLPDAGAVT